MWEKGKLNFLFLFLIFRHLFLGLVLRGVALQSATLHGLTIICHALLLLK